MNRMGFREGEYGAHIENRAPNLVRLRLPVGTLTGPITEHRDCDLGDQGKAAPEIPEMPPILYMLGKHSKHHTPSRGVQVCFWTPSLTEDFFENRPRRQRNFGVSSFKNLTVFG